MKIINKIEINSTPQKVFYWLSDPNRAMEWQTSVVETEIISLTPEITGTTFREVIEENGRRTEMYGRIAGFKQNEMISFHLIGKFNTVDIQFTLQKSVSSTLLIQTAEIHFKSYLKILDILLQPSKLRHTLKGN